MPTPNDTPNDAFPLERLFPGIHAARPDIAAYDAEVFLEHGCKPRGADLRDPELRRRLLEGPGEFVAFQIVPLPPEIASRVAALPENWQERTETHAEAEALNTAIEEHFALAPLFYVSLDENREAWVFENRAAWARKNRGARGPGY